MSRDWHTGNPVPMTNFMSGSDRDKKKENSMMQYIEYTKMHALRWGTCNISLTNFSRTFGMILNTCMYLSKGLSVFNKIINLELIGNGQFGDSPSLRLACTYFSRDRACITSTCGTDIICPCTHHWLKGSPTRTEHKLPKRGRSLSRIGELLIVVLSHNAHPRWQSSANTP